MGDKRRMMIRAEESKRGREKGIIEQERKKEKRERDRKRERGGGEGGGEGGFGETFQFSLAC